MAHGVMFLGTGNAFLPHGRNHSLAILDRKHLIDAPPTALSSMRKYGISPADLETIIFTHMHGDHIFGLPFILLERKYISDREGLKNLKIICNKSARPVLEDICKIAYPGSLDDMFEKIEFCYDNQGSFSEWKYTRFPVKHNDAVDPHGYKFTTPNGGVLIHSGDSGPCDSLYDNIEDDCLFILEMGVPEWVPSEEHHKPSHITSISEKHPNVKFAITHTFVDMDSDYPETVTSILPEHPENVIHSEDGDSWEFLDYWQKISN